MQFRPVVALVLAFGLGAPMLGISEPASAQTDVAAPAVKRLSDVLLMGDVVAVMRDEGIEYGGTLEDEMFPGRGGADWKAAVSAIYDTERMRREFDAQLSRELQATPEAIEQSLAFFESPSGKRILTLELDARRALTDNTAEEAAKVAVEDMIAGADPRMDVLRTFAEANALVELNVAGALNANLAFYQGLDEGGAFGGEMTEDQMLADVWGQEADVRAQTEEWVYSFLALAYAPLSDADMEAYQAFSESPAGQQVNAALFAAYDAVFTPISRKLGVATAGQMQGEDI